MSRLDRLHPGLQRWVKEQNWPSLRPVQEASIDPILEGRSCVIEAPTAGGKTEAVLFPTLTKAALTPCDSVQVLYIAPLRALLNNLETRGEIYAQCCNLQAFKWHGDVSQAQKIASLKTPPHLLMTTPESIEAMLLRKPNWRQFFSALEVIIIDEAHNFASGDRGGHLMALLERLEDGIGRPLQRIAVSATIGNPDAMCRWLVGTREAALRIDVPATQKKHNDFLIHYFNDSDETEETPTENRAGMRMLKALTNELRGRRGITFVRSRSKAEDVAKAIQVYSRESIKVRTHHSNISKFFREEAEALIKDTSEQGIETIVSTSTLELGIDIGELDRVIQMGSLASPSALLQRVGRTGRRPGVPRHFRGLVQSEEELLLLTSTVSLGLEHRSESLRLHQRAFHLLAHQTLCLALQEQGINPRKAWSILSYAWPFSGIKQEEYDQLIQQMKEKEFLREADGVLVPGLAAEQRYLTGNWRNLFAVFNTAPLYEVLEGRTQVGTLDTAFVESLQVPFFFTLAGRLWKAEKVDFDNHVIRAKKAKQGMAPKWNSFGGPDIPFETAQRVGELLHGYCAIPDVLDVPARNALRSICKSRPELSGWSPSSIEFIWTGSKKALVRTYAGEALNRTLVKLMASRGLKASGNYADVSVESLSGEEHIKDMVMQLLVEISDPINTKSFEAALNQVQSASNFSPFAPMLPESLIRATLVDHTTNIQGLQRLLAQCITKIEDSKQHTQ